MSHTWHPVPWKRNLRKVPKLVGAMLTRIKSRFIVVASTRVLTPSDIGKGRYKHLCITLQEQQIKLPNSAIIPSARMGIYSERNINGWEVIRKDLPKIEKTFNWETPNFGDAATYGTHTHYMEREVYQRDYYEGRQLRIAFEELRRGHQGEIYVKFSVDQLLDRQHPSFSDDLFFYLNLLQENTGDGSVYPSTATWQDFLSTRSLDWEIFPPGSAEQLIASLPKNKTSPGSPARIDVARERLALFTELGPRAYLKGTGGMASYVGAQYADDLVVFENLSYGNALYVLYDGWEEVSKRSRFDLLRSKTRNFDRFVHTEGWEERFRTHMKSELTARRRKKK